MTGLIDRVEMRPDGPATRRAAVPLRDLIGAFEAGDPPAKVAGRFELDAAELVAALAFEALGPDGSAGLGLVQGPPRCSWAASALGEREWAGLLPLAARPARLALAAGLLQVFDAWEASHEGAQQAGDLGERAVSAYWHGIAHRREPDSGNASYWFRRVGRHPLFAALGAEAQRLATAEGHPEVADRLAPGSVWNPGAFIALCADGRPAAGLEPLARRIQRREMLLLLEATAEGAGLALTCGPPPHGGGATGPTTGG